MRVLWRNGRLWYLLAVLLQGAILAGRLSQGFVMGEPPGLLMFLIPVLPSAYYGGLGPGLVCILSGALLSDYFLIHPLHQLAIGNFFYLMQWITMVILGLAITVTMHVLRRDRARAEQAAAAAQKATATRRLFVEQSPNAIAMFDMNMAYVAASAYWIDAFCGTCRDPMGRNHADFVPVLSEAWRQMQQSILSGATFHQDEDLWRLADGSERWINWTAGPWTDWTGHIGGVMVAAADISAHRAVAEGLRQARDQAEASSRAKTALLANVSHELRTPLNAVIGYSEALLLGLFGDMPNPRQREYLDDILSASRHLLELINDLLDTSALVSDTLIRHEDEIDVAALVATVLRYVERSAAAAGVTLHKSLEPDLPLLRGDARRMRQVLLNLLSNAVKFTPSGGHVDISVRLNDRRGLDIVVADTGIGMDAEDIPKALTPFGLQKNGFLRDGQGTGLGLSLAFGLVTLHGGTLNVASAKDKGTTVTVSLPPDRVGTAPIQAI